MNHHGPLPVGSGGSCGGYTTARNLLMVMKKHSQVGDILILVGDFNSGVGSGTIGELSNHLTHAMHGSSFGGVDNFFTNIKGENVVLKKHLGKGGSDHEALELTLRIGSGAFHWKTRYEFSNETNHTETNTTRADLCASMCQDAESCRSWSWGMNSKRCYLWDDQPITAPNHTGKAVSQFGFYSGYPVKEERGECDCDCSWADPAGTCRNNGGDDGSCCWKECCGRKREKHEVHFLQ